jgi:hypothetical protein
MHTKPHFTDQILPFRSLTYTNIDLALNFKKQACNVLPLFQILFQTLKNKLATFCCSLCGGVREPLPCVSACIYIYVYIYIYIYIHTGICIHVHTYTYIYIYTHIYIHTHIHIHIYYIYIIVIIIINNNDNNNNKRKSHRFAAVCVKVIPSYLYNHYYY